MLEKAEAENVNVNRIYVSLQVRGTVSNDIEHQSSNETWSRFHARVHSWKRQGTLMLSVITVVSEILNSVVKDSTGVLGTYWFTDFFFHVTVKGQAGESISKALINFPSQSDQLCFWNLGCSHNQSSVISSYDKEINCCRKGSAAVPKFLVEAVFSIKPWGEKCILHKQTNLTLSPYKRFAEEKTNISSSEAAELQASGWEEGGGGDHWHLQTSVNTEWTRENKCTV